MSPLRDSELLVVVGPTASGKTTLAAELASRLGGEVLSADSVQVYRGFDIGSGKPSPEELALAPHHLLDIANPTDTLEASKWAALAEEKIANLDAKGIVPIVCGGTFLWVRALLFGLADAPPGDASIRERHQALAEERGRAWLHEQLQEVDPVAAERLHPNDLVRVSRALEVHELTGETLSAIQERHGFREPRYRARLIGVEWPQAAWEARLRERVEGMFACGWLKEVGALLQQGYGETRAMDAVGYRQVASFLREQETLAAKAGDVGIPSREDLATLVDEVVRVTRIFARRQRTWLREEPIEWVAAEALSDSAALDELAARLAPGLRS